MTSVSVTSADGNWMTDCTLSPLSLAVCLLPSTHTAPHLESTLVARLKAVHSGLQRLIASSGWKRWRGRAGGLLHKLELTTQHIFARLQMQQWMEFQLIASQSGLVCTHWCTAWISTQPATNLGLSHCTVSSSRPICDTFLFGKLKIDAQHKQV